MGVALHQLIAQIVVGFALVPEAVHLQGEGPGEAHGPGVQVPVVGLARTRASPGPRLPPGSGGSRDPAGRRKISTETRP